MLRHCPAIYLAVDPGNKAVDERCIHMSIAVSREDEQEHVCRLVALQRGQYITYALQYLGAIPLIECKPPGSFVGVLTKSGVFSLYNEESMLRFQLAAHLQ